MKDETLPKLVLDRSRLETIEDFNTSDELEYWRNTTYEQRLELAYRLRWMAYGDKIRGRIPRVLEVVEGK